MQLSPRLKTSASLYSGSGNLFLITTDLPTPFEVLELCKRHQLDGVICYPEPGVMRTFNADGSEAQMCGNGLRCLIAFLWEHGECHQNYRITTLAGIHEGSYDNGWVRIQFPQPSEIKKKIIDGHCFYTINTGVPHAVYLGLYDHFQELGIRYVRHPIFGVEGSNITNCVRQEDGSLFVQTFERGVERITGACGTGCLAAATVVASMHPMDQPIKVKVPSSEELLVTLSPFTLCGKVMFLKNVAAHTLYPSSTLKI